MARFFRLLEVSTISKELNMSAETFLSIDSEDAEDLLTSFKAFKAFIEASEGET